MTHLLKLSIHRASSRAVKGRQSQRLARRSAAGTTTQPYHVVLWVISGPVLFNLPLHICTTIFSLVFHGNTLRLSSASLVWLLATVCPSEVWQHHLPDWISSTRTPLSLTFLYHIYSILFISHMHLLHTSSKTEIRWRPGQLVRSSGLTQVLNKWLLFQIISEIWCLVNIYPWFRQFYFFYFLFLVVTKKKVMLSVIYCGSLILI